MASANITLDTTPATIEVDTTERTYTFSPGNVRGVLYNAGSTKCWVHTAAGTVVTTDVQAQSIVGIPAGVGLPKPGETASITCKSTGTTTLYWYPVG